jgi:hypothetical protein
VSSEEHAKAFRLKGEGFKPGDWKNKEVPYGTVISPAAFTHHIARLRHGEVAEVLS